MRCAARRLWPLSVAHGGPRLPAPRRVSRCDPTFSCTATTPNSATPFARERRSSARRRPRLRRPRAERARQRLARRFRQPAIRIRRRVRAGAPGDRDGDPRPAFALHVRHAARAVRGSPIGPDRGGPHALLPPLQRETLRSIAPTKRACSGTSRARGSPHSLWIEWQRLNTPEHRERFDGGLNGDTRSRRT